MYNESFGSAFKRIYNSWPVALRTIITINVVVFLVQVLSGRAFDNTYIVPYLGFVTSWKTALFQPWRIVTYMFLHATIWHILFNMLWLWWMGRAVEETLGSRLFIVIYFGSGIGGALIDVLVSPFIGTSLVIGASGAVFGILVAFAVLYPRMPIQLILLPPIEARYVVAGLIAIEVLFLGSSDHVARVVHLGGALAGYLIVKSYYKGYDYNRLFYAFDGLWQRMKGPKVSHSAKNKHMKSVSNADVVDEKDQSELDRILEKISKTGYEGLTDEEKRILFELSKRN
ncbi:MAG TPA: rhomboid family intramembrane serine protease [Balneolales bacterium]|nr:rhomboid family intramembrane serine protease [Balneolales bacterium]